MSESLPLSLSPLVVPPPQQRMSQAWGLCCAGTSIAATQPLSKPQIINICREQLVPTLASAELCWDVLVEMICLLRGSREDVGKSAPSQLLQGVLQCRGLTVSSWVLDKLPSTFLFLSLPPFPPMPRFFLPSLLSSLTSAILALSASLPSLFLLCLSHTHTQTHT